MRVQFGGFVFDSRLRELRDGSERAHLTPKSLLLLETLLAARPQPLSKEFLYEHLWPSTFVEEANLKMLVSVLRVVLRDDARHPRWLKTIYGFGYAFESEGVQDLPESIDRGVLHQLIIGSRIVTLARGRSTLGRGADATILIDGTGVSRHHASIDIRADDAIIEDLGSKNGTFVGNRKLEAPTTLRQSDRIRMGSVSAIFNTQLLHETTVTYSEL